MISNRHIIQSHSPTSPNFKDSTSKTTIPPTHPILYHSNNRRNLKTNTLNKTKQLNRLHTNISISKPHRHNNPKHLRSTARAQLVRSSTVASARRNSAHFPRTRRVLSRVSRKRTHVLYLWVLDTCLRHCLRNSAAKVAIPFNLQA